MQVILHTGVHHTDEDRLLKCLLRNAEAWRHDGVAIPGPSKYRRLMTDAINKIKGAEPIDTTREVLLDAILQEDTGHIDRLVLSNDNFFCFPPVIFKSGRLYMRAEGRLGAFCRIFEQDEVELYMGLRDPATFLPAAFAASGADRLEDFTEGLDPMQLRWSDLIRRIQAGVPQLPITLWCNEDTPLVWGEIIRAMAGIEMTRKITGAFDLFSQIVSDEGMRRFRAFLKENPGINEMQRRRVMTAFLDKYAIEEALEEELEIEGWDGPYVDMLTEVYEEDLERIATMPGVSLITP